MMDFPVVGTFLNPKSKELRVAFNLGRLYAVVKLFDPKQPSHTVKFMEPGKFEDTLKWWRTVKCDLPKEEVESAKSTLIDYLIMLQSVCDAVASEFDELSDEGFDDYEPHIPCKIKGRKVSEYDCANCESSHDSDCAINEAPDWDEDDGPDPRNFEGPDPDEGVGNDDS